MSLPAEKATGPRLKAGATLLELALGCLPGPDPGPRDFQRKFSIGLSMVLRHDASQGNLKSISPRAARLQATCFCQSRQKVGKSAFYRRSCWRCRSERSGVRCKGWCFVPISFCTSGVFFFGLRVTIRLRLRWLSERGYLDSARTDQLGMLKRVSVRGGEGGPGLVPVGVLARWRAWRSCPAEFL